MKHWKHMIAIAVCCFTAACQKSCDTKQVSLTTLKIASSSDPASLDPRIDGTSGNQVIERLLFEGLMRLGEDAQPQKALAQDVSVSDDGIRYVFHLKKSFWNNGEKVTAHDFEYAWKSVIDKDSLSWYGYAFYPIKNARAAKVGEKLLSEVGIYAVDEQTLVVELEHPAPYFLELTANPVYAPVHKATVCCDPDWSKKSGDSFICNGPFTLVEHQMRNRLVLKKNPFFWDSEHVSIDQVECSIVPDSLTAMHLFETGELDWVGAPLHSLPRESLPSLKKSGKLCARPSSGIMRLEFNVEKAPFDHPLLRKALTLSLNRKELAEYLLKGGEEPALSLLPASMKLHEEPFIKDCDLDAARDCLQKALLDLNKTKEDLYPIVLSYAQKHAVLVQAIQQQWKEALGIDVQLDCTEWNVYLNKLSTHDFQMGLIGWTSWYNDPIYNLESMKFRDDAMNDTGWENPAFIKALDQADQTVDVEKRRLFLARAEEILMQDMPLCPLYYFVEHDLQNPSLQKVRQHPLGSVDFAYALLKK